MDGIRNMLRVFIADPGVIASFGLLTLGLVASLSLPLGTVAALFAMGWASYVVQEHLVHRYVFHAPAPRAQWLFNLLYRMHYGHHDQPRHKHLLFTPLWCSLTTGIINLAVVSLFLPPNETIVFVYGGGVAAYLTFEWVHLLCHFKARGRGRYAQYITRRHAKHHFMDFNRWFTVSPGGAAVDTLLFANPDEVERVPNAKTCGLDPEDPRMVAARQKFGRDDSLAMPGCVVMATD